jgi:tetratricopeptide (TPR) repeat protein
MIKKKFILIIFSLLLTNTSFAAGSGGAGDDNSVKKLQDPKTRAYKVIDKAKKLEKKGKIKKAKKNYKKAFEILSKYNKKNPSEPNVLNYLGFTSRKIGNFEDAEAYYMMGLSIDPNHNGINEYLGELYLQTNRKDQALERLQALASCNCEEYKQLKDIIDGKTQSKY